MATLETLESLSEYGASVPEIAAHLGVKPADLRKLPGFKLARSRGEAKRKLLLRQAEMKRALAGDSAALRRLLPTEADTIEQESSRRLATYLLQRAR